MDDIKAKDKLKELVDVFKDLVKGLSSLKKDPKIEMQAD